MPSSRRSLQPRDRTQVSRIAGRFFTVWATREAWEKIKGDFVPTWFEFEEGRKDSGGGCPGR